LAALKILAILTAAFLGEEGGQLVSEEWHVVHNSEFQLYVCKSAENIR